MIMTVIIIISIIIIFPKRHKVFRGADVSGKRPVKPKLISPATGEISFGLTGLFPLF